MAAGIFLIGMVGIANAIPQYYTFSGTVTSVLDRTGGIDITGFAVGDQVSYTFIIDFDAPGEHTQYDGDTFPIPDQGYSDYFYAHLLTSISSPTLPKYDGIEVTNPNIDEFKNHGLDWSGPPPGGPLGKITANSFYNEFIVYKMSLVSDWVVGESVNGQSKSMIYSGNNTWIDLVNMELELTSIRPASVPEPSTMILFGTGIAGIAGTWIRKKKK